MLLPVVKGEPNVELVFYLFSLNYLTVGFGRLTVGFGNLTVNWQGVLS